MKGSKVWRKVGWFFLILCLVSGCGFLQKPADEDKDQGQVEDTAFVVGCEVFLRDYTEKVCGQRVGLVTNQTGVLQTKESLAEVFYRHPDIDLRALYGPEHGLDGKAAAGEYVESYRHEDYKIPVYSLYGPTRLPTEEMLQEVDVLIFDIQDIGARTYTYMSTLNYCMQAAQRDGLPVMVLDRPNPIGADRVEGPVLEERFKSFIGVDHLPMAHGMTAGELALFYNRNIGADLTVISMEGYTRDMIFTDTNLPFIQTSPNIPHLKAAFGYMATGLGEGTTIGQRDYFTWIGGEGLDSKAFARRLNEAGLSGVAFHPDPRGSAGGVRLEIKDFYTFNPALTGIYALAQARQLKPDFVVPQSSGDEIVMFDKVMGTDQIGQDLADGRSPQEIVEGYQEGLTRFKEERKKYLIYDRLPQKADEVMEKIEG